MNKRRRFKAKARRRLNAHFVLIARLLFQDVLDYERAKRLAQTSADEAAT